MAARIWNIFAVCHERRDLVDAERICNLTLSMAILGDVVAHGNPFFQQLHHMDKNWVSDVAAVLPQEVQQEVGNRIRPELQGLVARFERLRSSVLGEASEWFRATFQDVMKHCSIQKRPVL